MRSEFDSPRAHERDYDDKRGVRKHREANKVGFGISGKSELQSIEARLETVLPRLSKNQVEKLRSIIHKHYIKRFKKSRILKYGNLDKGFTEPELQTFFKAVDNTKFNLLFSYQAQLGLRIGEAVSVNVKDINFDTRELTLKTEKAQKLDTLLIPSPLFKRTVDFISRNTDAVEEAGGYVFFKEWQSHSKLRHVDANYARNRFVCYIKRAGLNQFYGISDESNGRAVRTLHRLTTHSLRHYAITSFSRQTNGNVVLTSRFARHRDPATTMDIYQH